MNILISYLNNKILGPNPSLTDKWRVLQIISVFFNVELKRYEKKCEPFFFLSLSSLVNFLIWANAYRNDLSPFQNLLLTFISSSNKEEMEVESHPALTSAMVKESAEALLNRWHNKK